MELERTPGSRRSSTGGATLAGRRSHLDRSKMSLYRLCLTIPDSFVISEAAKQCKGADIEV
jgi:hypothetical protein